ncbi:hypothetical protein [Segniliparus rugosus]|uniref:O-antigen polysaccharide polymerase Wzy n=1 Tax=Segniliparus rugosus (strain ATCC BAA-974 / DSM 45345 / CCUG 50838 / CIP 108380 / JCM 13579 / CDC 945) TaxID=679197 RepID=E5XNP8_SEGRC|nr:hypothetical protein [Segniliparus rugosus]EFV14038.1 hypothetical protein HMPREF9336_01119 [Segniliparus rugosus ATCC BAA-974]
MPAFADLSPGYASVARVSTALIVLVLLAVAAKGVARILLLTQVVYWGVAFVGRSVLLLKTTPEPSFGDNIADPRLKSIGYDYGIAHVLGTVEHSLWVYVALVAAFVVAQRLAGPAPDPLPRQSSLTMATLATIWGLGMLARAGAYLTGSISKAGEVHNANPYLDILSTLCSIGALGIILYFHSESWWTELAVIGFFTASQLIWGIAEESKSPFMGAVLALAVRYLSTGMSRAKLAGIGAGGFAVVSLFGWMQAMKSSERATTMVNSAGLTYNLSYPEPVRPYLSIFRRFDLLEAATDVYYMNGQSWKRPADIARSAVVNLVPQQLGAVKVQSGPDWAQHVRGKSVDMSTISVSLAEGHLNEGYLMAGTSGVVLESLFVLGMIALVARCLRSRDNPVALTLGILFVSLPPLFERGVLGITETLGKSVQQCAIVGIIALSLWLCRELGERARTANAIGQRKETR